MTILFTPFDSYFDTAGRPTAAGQQLLSRLASALDGLTGIPDGGTAGQVLTKTTATNYDADWADLSMGSGTFDIDDGNSTLGGAFTFEEGGA